MSERLLLTVCMVLGTLQIWISRYSMNEDGVSYLDIGDAYFRGDWMRAVNGYWSPMYTWFLGLALHLFKPSIWWEYITVHAVNLIIYILALISFRFFLHAMLRSLRREEGERENSLPLPEPILIGIGYCIFLWASLVLIDAGYVTPDLLVAAIVFLIAGYLVELRYRESYGKFAVFGVLCAAGYLAKAVMFPLAFGLLAILLFSGRISRRRVFGVALAGFCFLLVSSPYIAALSKQKGRFTFGDSGRLAYADMVYPALMQKNWQGDPPEGGRPVHTTRQLLDHPPVFEFAQPIIGTYPPWFDPSYWDEGQHGSFRLRSQIRVLVQSARNYSKMLVEQLGLLAGLLIFIFWGGAASRRGILSQWPLILAAAFGLGIYSLVLVRSRYIGPWLALLAIAILAGIRLPRQARTGPLARYIGIGVMATILFSVFAFLAESAFVNMTVYGFPTNKEQIRTTEGLMRIGLHTGDPVAIIGDGTIQYWARLGRFKIVAEVFSPDAGKVRFWGESWERRKLAYDCMALAGAKMVVVWDPPEHGMEPGWKQIADSRFFALSLTK